MKQKIKQLTKKDIEIYADHLIRNFSESGSQGIYFSPFDPDYSHPRDKIISTNMKRIEKNLNEVDWLKIWACFDKNKIIGHSNLRGGFLETNLHRCQLGMGVESAYHRKGIGEKLLKTAIEWSKEQKSLDYIDLYVSAHNYKARKLYQKLGFKEIGRVEDLFRVRNRKLTDIHMVKKV